MQGAGGPGVANGCIDLGAITDDAGVTEQSFDMTIVIPCDLLGVKTIKRTPVVLALAQHGYPRQSGLGTLQDQKLEQCLFVVAGYAPLIVMVSNVKRVGAAPGATRVSVYRVHGRSLVSRFYGAKM